MNELERHLKKVNKDQFQQDLVSWFKKEQRDLPWRKDSDPYRVWVSEIMLQQTRVDTVIPYYEKFMETYPTIESFAVADEEAVLKIWEGLGYYSRVRNLHAAVKEVVEQYGGQVPNTKEEISKLKGVGPYTAGAVLSIAFGLPEPAVDGNVMRVMSRILLILEDIAKASSRKIFEAAVGELMYERDPSSFNQALMELGALICTPTSPACLLCPVREHCQAFAEGVEESLPIKTRKKSTKHEDLLAAVLQNEKGQYLIRKRPEKGLLANLWEFPNVKNIPMVHARTVLADYVKKELDLQATIESDTFITVNHIFTHLTWTVDAYVGQVSGTIVNDDTLVFVYEEELERYAFPVSHQKIWQAYKKHVNDR